MAESRVRNVEYKVLQWGTHKLQTAFRNSLTTLAGKFYAQGLLTTEVKRACSDSTTSNDACVEAVVSSLQDRVYNDPQAYYDIVEIVRNESGVSYIVKTLEEKREEIVIALEAEKEILKRKVEEIIEAKLKNGGPEGGLSFGPRPTQLSTNSTASLTIQSYTAPSRNIAAQSFQLNRSGPAEYSNTFPSAMPFNKTHNSSSPQSGDTFPLPASSPGVVQSR